MQTEEFTVLNVKCGGCVNNIQNGLRKLGSVSEVLAQVEGGRVTVKGEALSREEIAAKLAELGYPEA